MNNQRPQLDSRAMNSYPEGRGSKVSVMVIGVRCL